MTEEVLQEAVEPIQAEPTVGEQLRLAREAKQWSPLDVAQALKLKPRQVEALESGDWGKLPGQTFVRGFVRNYARLVGLDAERLTSLLVAAQTPEAQNIALPPSR